MSPRLISIALLALSLSVVLGCEGEESNQMERPSVFVPSSWKTHRRGQGHLTHIRADLKCEDCHLTQGSEFLTLGCEGCHEEQDLSHTSSTAPSCTQCHTFKEHGEASTDCGRCHEDTRVHKEGCTECHAPHKQAQRPLSSTCAGCHQETKSYVHNEGCDKCHAPHQPTAQVEQTCARCHEREGAGLMKGHEQCGTCHLGHKPAPTCVSCHPRAQKDPHGSTQSACVGCHPPHDKTALLTARPGCQGCHSDVLIDHPGSENACADCHAAHKGRTTCVTCHTRAGREQALHAGKLSCARCHTSQGAHALSAGAALGAQQRECEDCHKEAAAEAGKHATCLGCHVAAAHFPKLPTRSCGRCHEAVSAATSAANSGHAKCDLCHVPHSGNVKERDCAKCHEQPPDQHTKVERCQSCHPVHNASAVTDCASCHKARPGLHATHTRCADCHLAHDKVIKKDRETCVGCHRMPDHEPTAAQCVGCHLFR